MKIAVFSTPRTCSSLVCNTFANKFGLKNYKEILGTRKIDEFQQILNETYRSTDFVIKIFPQYIQLYPHFFKYDFFEQFDYIVTTERTNITDQICSWYLLYYRSENILNLNEKIKFDFNKKFKLNPQSIIEQIESIYYFYIIKNILIKKFNNKIINLSYEIFQDKNYLEILNESTNINFSIGDITSNTERTNLIYKDIFINYSDVDIFVKRILSEMFLR